MLGMNMRIKKVNALGEDSPHSQQESSKNHLFESLPRTKMW